MGNPDRHLKKLKVCLIIELYQEYKMSINLNTFCEPFNTNVKDIWSEPKSVAVDEIHKNLYLKLSKQEHEIAALTNLCQTFKAIIDETTLLKSEIETLKSANVELKAEMSSLLTGDFYIHAGGSPHGKISTNSGGTAARVQILSQDHMTTIFTGYDVAADGTVKCYKSGQLDNCYPLRQRWSFEKATDKLIRHPDGTLMSIPLDTSKVLS